MLWFLFNYFCGIVWVIFLFIIIEIIAYSFYKSFFFVIISKGTALRIVSSLKRLLLQQIQQNCSTTLHILHTTYSTKVFLSNSLHTTTMISCNWCSLIRFWTRQAHLSTIYMLLFPITFVLNITRPTLTRFRLITDARILFIFVVIIKIIISNKKAIYS